MKRKTKNIPSFLDGHIDRTCPICGRKNESNYQNVEYKKLGSIQFNYLMMTSKCEECSFLYQAPLLSNEFFNFLYSNYVGDDMQQEDRWKRELVDRRRSALSFSWFIKDASDFSILEVGCSSGYNLENIRRKFPNVYLKGVDIDEQSIKFGIKKGMNISVENAFDLNEKFDVVFLNHVFEHITEPIEFLKKLENLVKPGGIISINVPNSLEWNERPNYEHVNYFSEKSLTSLYKKAGIKKFQMHTDIINDKTHVVPEIRSIIFVD